MAGPTVAAVRSPWFQHHARLVLAVVAFLGLLMGVYSIRMHLQSDPLVDVRAYWEAGARLNAGQPLYEPGEDTNAARFYRYPPLLAMVFRPLALLPYEVAAGLWGIAMLIAFMVLVWRIGTGPKALFALGALALPLGWSLVIGQAQILVTTLVALGTPWGVALAANLKVFPIFVALYWLGRRDWRALRLLIVSCLVLVGIQLILEPRGTIAYLGFLNLGQVGEVYNLSPYALSPILWAILAVAGALLVLRLAPGRYGWAAAVIYSTMVTPRLLVYLLSGLAAAVRAPDAPREPGIGAWFARVRSSRTSGSAVAPEGALPPAEPASRPGEVAPPVDETTVVRARSEP